MDTLGGSQAMTVVNEAGLYRVLFSMEPNNARGVGDEQLQSRIEKLKAFKRWITHEVIPSIRKHGMYATPATVEAMLNDPDTMIQTLQALKEERKLRVQAEQKIEADKPKVLFAEKCLESSDSILIRELAKVYSKSGKSIGQNNLFRELRKWGLLNSSNEPYQRYIDNGYFEVIERPINTSEGTILKFTPKVLPKGQQYIINRLSSNRAIGAVK